MLGISWSTEEWLKSNVVSLYEKEDRTNARNSRGIGLLDTTYKLYARLVFAYIADALISEEQMDFRKGRSNAVSYTHLDVYKRQV